MQLGVEFKPDVCLPVQFLLQAGFILLGVLFIFFRRFFINPELLLKDPQVQGERRL